MGRYRYWKPILDYSLAIPLLVVFAPVMLLCGILIRLTSRGPAIYRQVRLGQYGVEFTIFKLRTMRDNCEAESGAVWAQKKDSRVTWIGWFLRATHLDEVPQLINILRGEMSLVGPRPERPDIVAKKLRPNIPNYDQRLAVKPGVTGLAQIYLPPDNEVPDAERKLQYDLHYIGRISFWTDVRLIACTGLRLFGISVRWLARMVGLPSPARIERPEPENLPSGETKPDIELPLIPAVESPSV